MILLVHELRLGWPLATFAPGAEKKLNTARTDLARRRTAVGGLRNPNSDRKAKVMSGLVWWSGRRDCLKMPKNAEMQDTQFDHDIRSIYLFNLLPQKHAHTVARCSVAALRRDLHRGGGQQQHIQRVVRVHAHNPRRSLSNRVKGVGM